MRRQPDTQMKAGWQGRPPPLKGDGGDKASPPTRPLNETREVVNRPVPRLSTRREWGASPPPASQRDERGRVAVTKTPPPMEGGEEDEFPSRPEEQDK